MPLHHYLNLFNHIVTKGNKQGDKYQLDDLFAWHGFDGYTCYISFKDLTMSFYFHNRTSFDFKEEQTLRQFEQLAKKILPP